MRLRNLSIAVAALVILSAVAWIVRRPPPAAAADPRVGQPVLAPDLARQAARVTLTDAGRSVEVTRSRDGTWTVPSYHDLPADLTKLSRLITDLGETQIRRLVTTRPESLARLEFKDTSIGLADETGKELWKLILGKTTEGGGRFLRYGDEPKGYLAPLSVWLDPEPKSWADPVLLDLKAGDIARFEIGFPTGETIVTTREKPDAPWTSLSAPAGQRLKADRVDAALSGVLTLRFTDTVAPDDPQVAAAKTHARTLQLATFAGQTYTLTFSRRPEEKRPKPAAPAAANPAADGAAAPDAPAMDAPPVGDAAPVPAATEAASAPPAPAAAEVASAPPDPAPPAEPEMETIPAGPVFLAITSSEPAARINAMMHKRAFQIGEWTFTGLPASPADFWEPIPAAAPESGSAPPPAATPGPAQPSAPPTTPPGE